MTSALPNHLHRHYCLMLNYQVAAREKRRAVSKCLATSVMWDTAGKKESFSPTPPKVLSWDLQGWLEGKVRKKCR